MIITRTPFRISFFGGGTDYPEWFRAHGGKVLSTTFNKYCYISVRVLPPFFEHKFRIVYSRSETVNSIDQIEHPSAREVLRYRNVLDGLEIHHDGDLPAKSGLGSSSAFTVGLLNALSALDGKYISANDLAKTAIHVEQSLINENVGSQDQVATAFGGFNEVEFFCDGSFSVSPVVISPARKSDLNSHLMLFFTGVSRIASTIAKSQINQITSGAVDLSAMQDMVDEAVSILRNENAPIQAFGKLLHEGWVLKKGISDKVSTSDVDRLYQRAMDAGALGGKLLGAGGGGFMLLFVNPDDQEKVREALHDLVYVPFDFESDGSKVVLYQPNGL